jgi:uncharacterized membrane protein
VWVAAIVVLFVITYSIDRAAYDGTISLPSVLDAGSADAARQLLSAIAAAVITVVGVVFSVTIVALTLASQQFGPRMLRTFIRDVGTQMTLGAFVATFVYAVLTLGSISGTADRHGAFVPNLSITVALGLLLIDLLVLIYFIHHIAVTIQLPQVIASISRDLGRAIEVQFAPDADPGAVDPHAPSLESLLELLASSGVTVLTRRSGYLQFVRFEDLVELAENTDSVIQLLNRPGHFITAGLPIARVWPAHNAAVVEHALHKAHMAGAQRTLTQDPVFPIDQLVEIAIRALSPAVNDTFTALTCIDWLTDALCKISSRDLPRGVHRDLAGRVRVIELGADYRRFVDRATDKIRQASRNMPAVAIRQIDGLTKVVYYTRTAAQRDALAAQADRILRASEADVPEADDRTELHARYDAFRVALSSMRDDADRASRVSPNRTTTVRPISLDQPSE